MKLEELEPLFLAALQKYLYTISITGTEKIIKAKSVILKTNHENFYGIQNSVNNKYTIFIPEESGFLDFSTSWFIKEDELIVSREDFPLGKYYLDKNKKLKIHNVKVEKTVTYEVEVIETDSSIPPYLTDDFKEWLADQALHCGLGRNYEYYQASDDFKEDIGVSFFVKVKK